MKADEIGDFRDDLIEGSARLFEGATGSTSDKLSAFPRFVDRTALGRFLVHHHVLTRILGVQGSIVDCGVLYGASLFAFAQLSAVLEPLDHRRQVVGFDTFSGFPAVSKIDAQGRSRHARRHAYSGAHAEELRASAVAYDRGRSLGHIPKILLVEGDFLDTGPRFLEENPHFLVALLYLDFDLYAPTRKALEIFLPRMPRGAIVAFDEVHVADFPGETQALMDVVGVQTVRLERLPFTSISWFEV